MKLVKNKAVVYLPAMLGMLLLPSCRSIIPQRVDFSGISDAFAPAENDDVQVEAGRGLPDNAVQPIAQQPAVIPPPMATGTSTAVQQPVLPAQPVQPTTGHAYTVKSGDTLSAIARNHRIPLSALYAANGLSETSCGIRPGQVLTIPAGATAAASVKAPVAHPVSEPAPAGKGSIYTVRKGDTLSSVARRYHTTAAALIKANALTPAQANKLSVGQTLRIPSFKRP